MSKYRFRVFLCALLSVTLLLGLASCGGKERPADNASSADFPVTAGGITLNAPPERIVCLSPSIGEVLDALDSTAALVGAGVGVSADSELPQVGTAALPDTEAIIQLSPDLVLTGTALPNEAAEKLALQEIPVALITAPDRYDQLEAFYTQVASLCGGGQTGAANAQRTVENLKSQITQITEAVKTEPAVKTCLLLGSETAATGDSLLGDILTLAGGDNAAGEAVGYAFSQEALIAAAPEVIICPSTLVSTITAGSIYAGIPAVQNGRVYDLDSSLFGMSANFSYQQALEALQPMLYNN